jgi:Coenzyme PQQ synthesis protein D (PqqD)
MTTSDPSPGSRVPVRRADVEWVELDREAVLYDPEAQVLHRLNTGAAAVWAACDGSASVEQITRAIEHTHSGPRDAITRDVAAAIDQLRRLRLLRPVPAAGGPAR